MTRKYCHHNHLHRLATNRCDLSGLVAETTVARGVPVFNGWGGYGRARTDTDGHGPTRTWLLDRFGRRGIVEFMNDASTQQQGRRYVMIMPTRDEAKHLGNAVESLAAQTILPARLVIVDDGSTDDTGRLSDEAAERYSWITVVHRPDRGERKLGGGVIDAFYAGYETLTDVEYDYVVKFDADITLPPGYFEGIMKKMEADPQLGSASGKVFNPVSGGRLVEEKIIDEMVAGQVKFYRRECFDDIGGLVREVMWDGIDFHRARMTGWKTQSFKDEDLRIVHHRLMGSSHKSVLHGRLRWGRGQWFMGTHPFYIFASGVFRMHERPYVIGGLLIIAGYIGAALRGAPRYGDLEFRRHLHAWQLKRLKLGFLAKEYDGRHGP